MNEILRPGLLDGLCIELRGGGGRLGESLVGLGAQVRTSGAPLADVDALVLDCAAWQAPGDRAGAGPLLSLLDEVWAAVLAVAVDGFISTGRGGRILFIAPAGAIPAAALENLSRTLSVEWARHSITTVTLAVGSDTGPGDLATVVAYLLSPAGAYFSGTRLELASLPGS